MKLSKIEDATTMPISKIEEEILMDIRSEGEYRLNGRYYHYCEYCDSMQDVAATVISGKVGHIDNWMPDECIIRCKECDEILE